MALFSLLSCLYSWAENVGCYAKKQKYRGTEHVNQELTNYIKENLAKGVPEDQIRQSLLAKGWKQADIDAAFVQLAAPPSSLPPFPIKPPSTQNPPLKIKEPKSFFNPKILIAAIAVIFLLTAGGGFYFFVFKEKSPATENSVEKQNQQGLTTETPNQTGSNQDQVKLQTPQTQSPTSGKDYSACFSKYDENFMPENIGNYKKTIEWGKSPTPQDNFSIIGSFRVPVNWGLTGLYSRSQQELLLFAVADVVDINDYHFQDLQQGYNNEVINGLPVVIGTVEDSPENQGVLIANTFVRTIVPSTKVYIIFGFKPQENRPKEIFSNWLNSVCS